MIDQKRLERIKWNFKNGYDFNPSSAQDNAIEEDFDWLIQQAERSQKNAQDLEDMDRQLASEQKRVRELEMNVKLFRESSQENIKKQAEEKQQLEKHFDELYQKHISTKKDLEKHIKITDWELAGEKAQNKRYKQAIEEIAFQASLVETSDNVQQVIDKALAGESNEVHHS
ncbi:hypothetical protein SAMN05216389_14011 [Oceanobacillus limi]|uniref:Uncharacterized protein n=1 Tax=Oceanobacillus limi TaxID=930131 RepID=A0A1I0HPJ5_9BACI|nr:hypothetical protein [Oceanobacillus limi]SET85041.1 hypothetical protein SAMN05216389_14011 [Oceanobacillus limi]